MRNTEKLKQKSNYRLYVCNYQVKTMEGRSRACSSEQRIWKWNM